MGMLPRPASRKSVDTGEGHEDVLHSEASKNEMKRRFSLKAADSISDLLGSISRPSFFRSNSKAAGMTSRRGGDRLGVDSVLRSEDGVKAVREFSRSFPGMRKYLEFWLEVGGLKGFKDSWNTRTDEDRAAAAETIAAKYLRDGSEHKLNEGGISGLSTLEG